MVAWLGPAFRFGIGYALPPKGRLRDNWKERATWGLITLGLTSGWVLKPVEARVAAAGWWGLTNAWRLSTIAVSDTAIMARAFAGTQTGQAAGRLVVAGAVTAAAVGVGYTAGAVAGTVIISQAEKKEIVYEGATEDVLDFYMGEGHYWEQGTNPTPGYFNIPGNVSLIADHVKHGHYFGH